MLINFKFNLKKEINIRLKLRFYYGLVQVNHELFNYFIV